MARTRRDRATWVKLIEEWESSGQIAEDFAAGRDLNPSTLKWWKSTGLSGRSRKKKRARRKPEPRLVPVTVRANAVEPVLALATPAWLEAVVPETGVRLRFSVGTDTGYLAQLLVAVGGGAC